MLFGCYSCVDGAAALPPPDSSYPVATFFIVPILLRTLFPYCCPYYVAPGYSYLRGLYRVYQDLFTALVYILRIPVCCLARFGRLHTVPPHRWVLPDLPVGRYIHTVTIAAFGYALTHLHTVVVRYYIYPIITGLPPTLPGLFYHT